jgi:hypothetical protein
MSLKTIVYKGSSCHDEALAGGTITPGHLLQRTATGTVVVHATAAGNAEKMFAIENELAGKDIDTNYASGDTTFFEIAHRAARANALVAAAAPAITAGDYLESAGNGTLRKQVVAAATTQAQRESVVAVALESVDNSAGGSPVRIKVEVL